MSTITTATIDRALEILIRADIPLLIENHVRGQVDVLMSLDVQTAGLHTWVALQVGRKLARLGRIANSTALLMAARELGAEMEPAVPAEHDKAEHDKAEAVRGKVGASPDKPSVTVEISIPDGDKVRTLTYRGAKASIESHGGVPGSTPDRVRIDLIGDLEPAKGAE